MCSHVWERKRENRGETDIQHHVAAADLGSDSSLLLLIQFLGTSAGRAEILSWLCLTCPLHAHCRGPSFLQKTSAGASGHCSVPRENAVTKARVPPVWGSMHLRRRSTHAGRAFGLPNAKGWFCLGRAAEKAGEQGTGQNISRRLGWAGVGKPHCWCQPRTAAAAADLPGLSDPWQRACYSASGSSAVSATVLVPKGG